MRNLPTKRKCRGLARAATRMEVRTSMPNEFEEPIRERVQPLQSEIEISRCPVLVSWKQDARSCRDIKSHGQAGRRCASPAIGGWQSPLTSCCALSYPSSGTVCGTASISATQTKSLRRRSLWSHKDVPLRHRPLKNVWHPKATQEEIETRPRTALSNFILELA